MSPEAEVYEDEAQSRLWLALVGMLAMGPSLQAQTTSAEKLAAQECARTVTVRGAIASCPRGFLVLRGNRRIISRPS